MSAAPDGRVRIVGAATPAEVAAVVSALAARAGPSAPDVDAYEAWRRTRIAALGPAGDQRRAARPEQAG